MSGKSFRKILSKAKAEFVSKSQSVWSKSKKIWVISFFNGLNLKNKSRKVFGFYIDAINTILKNDVKGHAGRVNADHENKTLDIQIKLLIL